MRLALKVVIINDVEFMDIILLYKGPCMRRSGISGVEPVDRMILVQWFHFFLTAHHSFVRNRCEMKFYVVKLRDSRETRT